MTPPLDAPIPSRPAPLGRPWLLAGAAFALAVAARAAPPGAAGTPAERPPPASPVGGAAEDLALSIQRATLDNGLRVVMNVDRSSPNVAVCVTYDVGSRNEEVGKAGFAHLFEHMMFQGSGNVEKGQHFTLITSRGGTLNGTTSTDRTNYFEMLPSSELALALWLEADRMKSLAVTAENVENQRAVVQEEYRMRVSNQAYAEGQMRLRALAFEGYFPYGHDPIGIMADLDAAKLEYVAAFHAAHYAPDNAVLAISGDFDTDHAMALVQEYFGDARRRAKPAVYSPPPLPAQAAPRSDTVRDENAKNPAVLHGWTIPPTRTPEHYALEIATVVLGGGESARLHQRLVRGEGKAQSVASWTYDQRGPDLFVLRAVLSDKGKPADVERILTEEIEQLAITPPSDAELEKARTRVTSHMLFGLESNMKRATQLAEFELYWGDARLLSRELSHYRAVTATQVRDAVKTHLTRARRSSVHVLPPEPAAKTPAAKTPAARTPDGAPASHQHKHEHKKEGTK